MAGKKIKIKNAEGKEISLFNADEEQEGTHIDQGLDQDKIEIMYSSLYIEQLYPLSGKDTKLEDYQKITVDTLEQFNITNKSRRIGHSTINAVEGLHRAHVMERYTRVFISYCLEDAKEKIRIAQDSYDCMDSKIKKKLVSKSKTALEFLDFSGKSTSRIISLSCRSPRGKGGDLSMDEMAFFYNDQRIYTASLPLIVGGYKVDIGSTPFGNNNMFYQIVTDTVKYSKYRRMEVPWWHCTRLCLDVENAKKYAPAMGTRERVYKYGTPELIMIFESMMFEDFCQEYECQFQDERTAFIPYELILRCTPGGKGETVTRDDEEEDTGSGEIVPFKNLDDLLLNYNEEKHGKLYAGYDVGRTTHASELVIVGVRGNISTVLASISYRKQAIDKQADVLNRLTNSGFCVRLSIDQTGLGVGLVDVVKRNNHNKCVVEGILFDIPTKEMLANNLYMYFERGLILLPRIRELHQQIHSIRRVFAAGKHARFDVDGSNKHHADKFWALALGVYASGRKTDTLFKLYSTLNREMEQQIATELGYDPNQQKTIKEPTTQETQQVLNISNMMKKIMDTNIT